MSRLAATYGVEVRACTLGCGLFSRRLFQPGETIIRFRGRRVDRDDPLHSEIAGANLLQTGLRTYILPDEPAVFANHSCNPNAGVRNNRLLVAIHTILPGEEIRFDYSTTMDEGYWTMPCACGEPTCRGVVRDFVALPDQVRERYLALGLVQGFIARRYRRH